ncbi:YdcF family protein [Aliikangiella maris]|uniref:YdcF family protein n=2 Tax=Aliikangiella maris TaxID=3162458 RepID=A0ABV2BWK7_9GAMM
MSFDIFLSYSFKAILLPPGINLLIAFIALLLIGKYRKSMTTLITVNLLSLLILSLPSTSDLLVKQIEANSALSHQQVKHLANDDSVNRAIVVLSGGRINLAPEYGDIDTVNSKTLQRLHYASWLHKRTGLPILLSGGRVFDEATAESVIMNQVMISSFGIAPKWIESDSKNTAENARYSVALLQQSNIDEIVLVTHALHMPRAQRAFAAQGIKIIPAATVFQGSRAKNTLWTRFLPDPQALLQSSAALHEILGQIWYDLRY